MKLGSRLSKSLLQNEHNGEPFEKMVKTDLQGQCNDQKAENVGRNDRNGTKGNEKSYWNNIESLCESFKSGSTSAWWWTLVLSTALAVATRLYRLQEPYAVIWDEAHFGKMTSLYLNRTYFFDVHPPGGKLVLTMFAALSGFNGSFNFEKPGVSYEGHPEILAMRMWCALLGASLAPLSFGIAWTATGRLPGALIAAVMVITETGTLALTKFILLDSPLMFFMMATFFGICKLHYSSESHGSFSRHWWGCLLATGLMLGCVASVKFVGLFMVAVVGLYTVQCLWDLFAISGWVELLQHFLARVLGLIVVPISVYIAFFAIHDVMLNKSDSPFYFQECPFSPAFQMHLVGNNLHNLSQPKEVAYGNLVTIRNSGIGGGYLHSHNYTYPHKVVAGKKQQVTAMGVKDGNNLIRILFPEDDPDLENGYYSEPLEYLAHEDIVRLYHNHTGALIGCGVNSSAVTQKHYLVYSQPINRSQDPDVSTQQNFIWQVMVTQDGSPKTSLPAKDVTKENHHDSETDGKSISSDQLSQDQVASKQMSQDQISSAEEENVLFPPVLALTSKVRFRCVTLNKVTCYLTWSRLKLPHTWGLGQEEVSCSKQANDPYNEWLIEENINPSLPNSSFQHLESSFPERVVEAHRVMQFRNSRMKQVGLSKFSQRPWMWPIGYTAYPWYDNNFRVVLLGNPLVLLLNFVALVGGTTLLIWKAFSDKRSHKKDTSTELDRLVTWSRWLLIAYLFHYLPFFTMDRILYYHHYFPALQFSSLLTALLLGHCVSCLRTPVQTAAATAGIVAALLASFYLYCNLSYGHPTVGAFNPDNSTFRHLKVYNHWEI